MVADGGYRPWSPEDVLMYLASDYIHPTPRAGRCRIRIFLPEEEQDAPVVICSKLPNNGGTSVTNAAEQLAAEVSTTTALLGPSSRVVSERMPSSSPERGTVGAGAASGLARSHLVRSEVRGERTLSLRVLTPRATVAAWSDGEAPV